MIRITFILLSLTFCVLVNAQAVWEKSVQFFTPNAESFGKYGQVPVNYFNGLPQISIPITTFKAKGYELPVYLSYYAAGNKPDSHPGWVGLGWNLSAGGSINRIINGIKDETTTDESIYFMADDGYGPGRTVTSNTGYYYSGTDNVNRPDWKDSTYLNTIFEKKGLGTYFYDTEPDEFQVNIDGISASFYLMGNNQVKIKSKSGDNFKVEITLDTNLSYKLYPVPNKLSGIANLHTYISEILLTKDNGIKYHFGGDMSSIEFSYFSHEYELAGNANTWHIKKIDIPNGETITFNYEKKGIPIIEQNNHFYETYTNLGDGTVMKSVDSKNPKLYHNYSYTFIQPSFLTSIESTITKSSMSFKKSKSIELACIRNENAFNNNIWGSWKTHIDYSLTDLNNENYYMQLDTVVYNDKKYVFQYSNSTNTRLKLQNILILDNKKLLTYQYAFKYNTTPLPDYNSKRTDNWGFYNNIYYDTIYYWKLYAKRRPEFAYMKAEILEKIIYPTGGYTQFTYEPNDYSKIATQLPFGLKNSSGIAGGLRIKQIKTVNTDKQEQVREVTYQNKDNQSSGILSGIPIHDVSGRQHVHAKYSGWQGWSYNSGSIDYNYGYDFGNEQIMNQLANTSGNHLTYSRVIEKLSDGSKTIYNYTNHEKYPDENPTTVLTNIDSTLIVNSFISKELERGLLDSVEYYRNDNIPVKKELYKYNSNPGRYDDFVKSINAFTFNFQEMIRISALKIYTFYPYMESKKEVTYNNDQQLITETKYKYDNNNRILTNQVVKDSKGDSLTTVFTYPFHITYNYLADAPVPTSNGGRVISPDLNATCSSMNTDYFLNSPVEVTTFKNTKIINSKFLFYGKHGSDYLPDSIFSLETNVPINTFTRYSKAGQLDGKYEKNASLSYIYDSKSNIIQMKGKNGLATTFLWSYNYQYPVAEIKNAYYDNVKSTLGIDPETIAASILPDTSKINALRKTLPNALVTTYTYKPLVGMTSKIDQRGVRTRYDYDTFNRLGIVNDNNDKTLISYNYKYKDYIPGDYISGDITGDITGESSFLLGSMASFGVVTSSTIINVTWILDNVTYTRATLSLRMTSVGAKTLQCIVTDNTGKSITLTKDFTCNQVIKTGKIVTKSGFNISYYMITSNGLSCSFYMNFNSDHNINSYVNSNPGLLVGTISAVSVEDNSYFIPSVEKSITSGDWVITIRTNGEMYLKLTKYIDLGEKPNVLFPNMSYDIQINN